MAAAQPPRAVHQLTGAFHLGDAVGNEALVIRRHLREAGFESEIFAGWRDPRAADVRPLRAMAAVDSPQAVWLYHFSPGSPASGAALAAAGRLALAYHNVTPARWFLGWSEELARLALQAPAELRALAPRATVALAKSEFSRRDLDAAGFPRSAVLPFLHDPEPPPLPAPVLRGMYADGRTNLVCVGRLAPNKRIERVLAAFAVLQRLLPRARLLIVGDRSLGAYVRALERRARDLRLREVVFLGHVEPDELLACYQLARVFVSLSAHEGYGVPLVEAMRAEVPVLACDAGAVAETLAGAGLLVPEDTGAEAVAALLARLVEDQALRAAVLEGQRRVVATLRAADGRAQLLSALAPALEAA